MFHKKDNRYIIRGVNSTLSIHLQLLLWNLIDTLKQDKSIELDKIANKKKKIFQAYEEEIIDKNEFSTKMQNIKSMQQELENKVDELKQVVGDYSLQQVPYEFVKSIMESFHIILKKCSTREQQKKLLHMLM